MNGFALVLNAGSSSLKFSVYKDAETSSWALDARGQIDGIGTSPRFSAVNGSGVRLADDRMDLAVDALGAIEGLAGWLRSRFGGAKVVAVGHRVVHGGATYTGPVIVTPAIVRDLRQFEPLAPLHQPYNI